MSYKAEQNHRNEEECNDQLSAKLLVSIEVIHHRLDCSGEEDEVHSTEA